VQKVKASAIYLVLGQAAFKDFKVCSTSKVIVFTINDDSLFG
jgi:hypothetical protein